jgi:NADPH:quinone reductase-like Zn-dependent oxidoreductase
MSINLMKSLRFTEFGSPSVLRIEEVPIPEPGEGEALVHVKAAAINPSDIGNAGTTIWRMFHRSSVVD